LVGFQSQIIWADKIASVVRTSFGKSHPAQKLARLSASADGESARYFGLSAELTNVRPLGPVPFTWMITGSFTSTKWTTFAGSV